MFTRSGCHELGLYLTKYHDPEVKNVAKGCVMIEWNTKGTRRAKHNINPNKTGNICEIYNTQNEYVLPVGFPVQQ